MTILSAQSIRNLCQPITKEEILELAPTITLEHLERTIKSPLITPFTERGVTRGRSYGLSACTYDCRISHPLIIPVRQSRLAVTMEQFNFPNNICGSVLDKSSWARVFISAFNTHLDPGWCGYLTLELSNLSEEYVEFHEGDPICQIKFEWLDEPTELPYRGKYQDQGSKPTPVILEEIK